MIRKKILFIGLLGSLLLFLGCVPMTKTTLGPGSPEDLTACTNIFPVGPWESVHKIEAVITGGVSSSLLGVTRGDPDKRRLHNLLLTPEGFILFEGLLGEDGMAIQKAVPPFDSPVFAGGLMEDVKTLFLPPPGKPERWGRTADGTRICVWEGPDGFRMEVRGSKDQDRQILLRDNLGEVIKEVSLKGPFVNGLASHMELRASKPVPYKLKMTLLQISP